MIWFFLTILFTLYVVFSLMTIKSQLNSIARHLNVDLDKISFSDEEIERAKGDILFDEVNK